MFVVDQVVRLAGGEDGAVADDVGPVADAEGFAYVVVGNEYADAARFEEVDDFLDVDDGNGVDAGKGSSKRMKRGCMASTRAISTRRRSPPDREGAGLWRRWPMLRSASSFSTSPSMRLLSLVLISKMARMFCSTVILRKIEASCGR